MIQHLIRSQLLHVRVINPQQSQTIEYLPQFAQLFAYFLRLKLNEQRERQDIYERDKPNLGFPAHSFNLSLHCPSGICMLSAKYCF